MKNIFRFLPALALMFIVSCISSDDDFTDNGGSFYNEGQVSFDGITIPITYADFYLRTTIQGGEIWTLILSEEFLGHSNAHSDAYLVLDVFRPAGMDLEGFYDMYHPVKFIDYAAYYENVMLYNGNPNSYGFHIPDKSFTDGRLRVQHISGNIYYFEVRLNTYNGQLLTSWFEGKLRY